MEEKILSSWFEVGEEFLEPGTKNKIKEKTAKFNCMKLKNLSPLRKKSKKWQASQGLQHDKELVSRKKKNYKSEKKTGSLIEKCARHLNKYFRGYRKCPINI